ncbi:MAG TPA: hypothetical protein V6C82_06330 [Chroococcales cyanobacterium]
MRLFPFVLFATVFLSAGLADASTFWKIARGTIVTSDGKRFESRGAIDWSPHIPPKGLAWLEVRFPQNQRLKGLRFVDGVLGPGLSYRIETCPDGHRFFLRQSGKWPEARSLTGLAFDSDDETAFVRSLRITLTSSLPGKASSFSLRDLTVFVED